MSNEELYGVNNTIRYVLPNDNRIYSTVIGTRRKSVAADYLLERLRRFAPGSSIVGVKQSVATADGKFKWNRDRTSVGVCGIIIPGVTDKFDTKLCRRSLRG